MNISEIVNEEEVENKFAGAIDRFGLYIPNLLTFYAIFRRRENRNIQTIRLCVTNDVNPVIEYNPFWVMKTDSGLFTFLLSIEIYRFLLHHITKREIAGPLAFKASNAICNCNELHFFLNGCDREVIKYVEENLPSKESIEKEIMKAIDEEDWYYERVYLILKENEPESPSGSSDDSADGEEEGQKSSSSNQSKSSSGSKSGEEDDSADSEETQNGSGEDDKSSDSDLAGDTDGNDQTDSKDGKNGKSGEDANDLQKDSFDEWNQSGEQNTEEWGDNPVVDELIRDAIENKAKLTGWGKLGGDQVEAIMMANKRNANIMSVIRSFQRSIRSRKRLLSRMKLNKRFPWVYAGHRTDRKSKILFAVDSSGSMSKEDLELACSILHNFYKQTEIWLAFWDAKMTKPVKLSQHIKMVKAEGRGGTDPHCIGEYLEHYKLSFDGVVLFTDCWWSWTEDNLPCDNFVISSEEDYAKHLPKFVKHHCYIQKLLKIKR